MQNRQIQIIMKKLSNKILIIAASLLVVAALIVIGISSLGRTDLYQLSLDSISEARFYMKFSDEHQNLKVQFFTGMREEPYNSDGVASKTTAFAIINVEPRTGKDKILDNYLELKGTLKIGDEQLEVTLDKNPFDRNFACDLERLVDENLEVTFTLRLDTDTIIFTLQDAMPDNAIKWERALEIATETMESKLEVAGKFEVHVRIVHNIVQGSGGHWYVQFNAANGEKFFCVIDPEGKVIS